MELRAALMEFRDRYNHQWILERLNYRTPEGEETVLRKPMKIGAATPYDFKGANLTPYGGL